MNTRSKFGVVAVVMLAVVVLYNVACLAAAFGLVAFIGEAARGTSLSEAWWIRNILARVMPPVREGAGLDMILGQLWDWARGPFWLWYSLGVCAVLAYGLWLFHADRELRKRENVSFHFRWSAAAIAGFFVPVANLWVPYVVTRDVCRAAGAARSKPWARWAWEFYLLHLYFGGVAYLRLKDVFLEATGSLIGWHLFGFLAAIFGILVVRAVEQAMLTPLPPSAERVAAPVWWDVVLVGAMMVAVLILFGKHQMERRLIAMKATLDAEWWRTHEGKEGWVRARDGTLCYRVDWEEMIRRGLVRRFEPELPTPEEAGGRTSIVVEAVIAADGTVQDVYLPAAPDADTGFGRAVLDAVAQWKFPPTFTDGRVVPGLVTISFRLEPRRAQAPLPTMVTPKGVVTVQPVEGESAEPAPVEGGVPGGVLGGVISGVPADISTPTITATNQAEAVVVPWPVMMIRLIHRVDPVYPSEAPTDRRMTVTFKAEIAGDGTVQRLTILKPAPPEFEQAAREAVMQWKFRPYLVNGQPVTVSTMITIMFSVQSESESPD